LKTAQFDVVTKNACLDAIGLVALFSVVGQVANWFVFNMFDIGNTLLPDLDTT
jgi:hypothetical protein